MVPLTRRHLLTLSTGTMMTSLAGCLDQALNQNNSNNSTNSSTFTVPDGAITPSESTDENPDENCGPADVPLTALFTTDTGTPEFCSANATTSLAIENQLEESVAISVDLTEGESFSGEYTIEPDERIVEWSAFSPDPKAGTVSIDGGADQTIAWPERSCFRHGIAITTGGIQIGWIEPVEGPGDTQHDCYAGDDALIMIYSEGPARSVLVSIADLCTGETVQEILDVSADGTERIEQQLTNGGMFEVTVEVENGDMATLEFFEACWGVNVSIDEDAAVTMNQILID